jgi:hypothetical protein
MQGGPPQAFHRQCLENVRLALVSEAEAEAGGRGSAGRARLSGGAPGRYPFDEASPTAASPADVARLLNPKSGGFWKAWEELQALQATTIDGRPR